MSQARKILTEKTTFLNNPFWKEESLVNGLVVLHTVKCQKISDKIIYKLNENDFNLENIKRKQELVINTRNSITSTELHEVQIDKIKVTEGSIVSINTNGKNRSLAFNEGQPIARDVTNSPASIATADFKKIEHERLIFKSEVARGKNSFFFRAKDSENLFRLGDNFYKDFKSGYKHFSFAHLGAAEAQKKSILGIASFIYYFENLRILIVTDKMDGTFFESFKKLEHKQEQSLLAYPEFKYDVHTHEGISYLEVDEIASKSKSHEMKGLEYLLKKVMDDYDVVLYDIPAVSERKDKYDIYFPLLQIIQNVTFTLSLSKSTFTEVEDLKKYFLNYKIKLKGCVLEQSCNEKGNT